MRHRGFTLIELLVVISVIALLMGLLLPALGVARRHARMCRELAAGRQLGQAYLAYAVDHEDYVLPGKVPATISVRDGRGGTVTGPAAQRYPWRLAAYVDHGFDGSMYANDQFAQVTAPGYSSYLISLQPSFGYNYYHVGGDENTPANNREGCLRRLIEAAAASRQVVFGSARMNGEAPGQFIPGFERIEAPRGSSHPWPEAFTEALAAEQWGYVDPRWDGRAAFVHLDGHVELLGTLDMRDMTRWSDAAARRADPDFDR